MHQAEMMKLAGLVGVTQSNLVTSRAACSCLLFHLSCGTCVQMLRKSWIPSFSQEESCVGYPAADPGALCCQLAQELLKSTSISQSFTIANAEMAALCS